LIFICSSSTTDFEPATGSCFSVRLICIARIVCMRKRRSVVQ
jgi:hypothetical protein